MSSSDKQSSGKLSKTAAKWPKHATDKPSKASGKVPKSGIGKTKKSKRAIEKALKREMIEKSIKQSEMANIEKNINAEKGESAEVKNDSKDEPMEVETGEASKERDIEEGDVGNEGRGDVAEARNEGDSETVEVIIEGVIVTDSEDEVEEKEAPKTTAEQRVEEMVEKVIENVKKYEEKDVGASTSSVDSSMEAECTYSASDEGATSASSVEGEQLSLFRDKSGKDAENFTKTCAKVMGAAEVDNEEKGQLGKESKNIKKENKLLMDQVKEYPEAYDKSEDGLLLVKKVDGEVQDDEKDKKEGGEKLKGDEENPKV